MSALLTGLLPLAGMASGNAGAQMVLARSRNSVGLVSLTNPEYSATPSWVMPTVIIVVLLVIAIVVGVIAIIVHNNHKGGGNGGNKWQ